MNNDEIGSVIVEACEAPSMRSHEKQLFSTRLDTWNDTDQIYSNNHCIHELFEKQVTFSKNSPAVNFGDLELTYSGLNDRANQLARYFISRNVKPDDLIAIYAERSLELVVSILAVLKAGCAYVPLEPDYPEARTTYMLEDSKPVLVVALSKFRGRLESVRFPVIYLDDENFARETAEFPSDNVAVGDIGLKPNNLAYVIYTSGSTGHPKGVMIEHNGLVNRIEWMKKKYGCDLTDSVLQKTPFSFDVSVWEFFLPLISGARIVLAKPGGQRDTGYISSLVQKKGITKIHFVPSMLHLFLTTEKLAACTSLRQVFCSGEALHPSHVELFYKSKTTAKIYNLYGPTEASIDVSHWDCDENDATRSSVPIGKPIDNTKLYIVNSELELIENGTAGELLIGGVGLARGYLNRPELTVEKFIFRKFQRNEESRFYRTGDLCRFLPDGNVEFLGRMDHQIKIRGFRVELGEIENTLNSNKDIHSAAVVKSESGAGSSLTAFMVGKESLDTGIIATYLKSLLPEYMVPTRYIVLDSMPLTANGKLDRNALTQLLAEKNLPGGSYSEMSYIQKHVFAIWCRFLGTNSFTIDDDLFMVGGDSITAIQIFSAVNAEFSLNISIEEIFSSPHFSIRWLSELIETCQIGLVGEDEYVSLLKQIDAMSDEEIAKLLNS